MRNLTGKAENFNSNALAEDLLTAAELEAAHRLIEVTCNDWDCHGDHDPRHRAPARLLAKAARGCRAEELAGPLELGRGTNWLIVNCDLCGPLAWGAQNGNAAAEELQASHAERYRGHRVTVELFFREAVSEKTISKNEPAPRAVDHRTDADCTLDETGECLECGVYHGDPCDGCGGRGYHAPSCKLSSPQNFDRN